MQQNIKTPTPMPTSGNDAEILKSESQVSRVTYIVTQSGKKKEHFCLWREVQILVPGFHGYVYNYVQNLGLTVSAAIANFKKVTGLELNPDDISKGDSLAFKAFGINFDYKVKNEGLMYYGKTSPEFWEAWKANKDELKNAGFWVSKDKKTGDWWTFFNFKFDK